MCIFGAHSKIRRNVKIDNKRWSISTQFNENKQKNCYFLFL
jgi:hypothetical protein